MMLAHDIVGKKEDKDNIIERQYNSLKMYWCEIYVVVCFDQAHCRELGQVDLISSQSMTYTQTKLTLR